MNKILLIICFLLLPSLYGTVYFQLKEKFVPVSKNILLKDLISDNDIEKIPVKLQNLFITFSPFKRESKIVESKSIINKLRNINKVKYLPYPNKTVIIQNEYKILSSKKQKEIIMTKLHEIAKNEDYELIFKSKLKPISYPIRTRYSIKLENRKRIRISGNQLFIIKITLDGRLYRKIMISTFINLKRNVLVAKAKIKKGSYLKREMFEIKKCDVTGKENEVIYNYNSINGFKAKSVIFGDKILRKTYINKIPDINRGAVVSSDYYSSGISLSFPVKSLQNCFVGDVSKFQSVETKKIFSCLVLSKTQVEVRR